MHYDVFISYSRVDSKVAERVCKALAEVGLSYFIDRKGISAGVSFTEVVSKAIDESSVFLFLASASSYKSKFTTAEVFYAFKHKESGMILPYLLDNSPMPSELEFLLSTTNWLEMKGNPIETSLVDAVFKALSRPRDTVVDYVGGRKKPWLPICVLALVLCCAAVFALRYFWTPAVSHDADIAAFNSCIAASDSLLASAMMLKNQASTLETTDQQIQNLIEARQILSSADSLALLYKGTPDESFFNADVPSRRREVQAKLDSIFNSWVAFSRESYELYRLTGLETEAENALECIEHALLIKPDPEMEGIKIAIKL